MNSWEAVRTYLFEAPGPAFNYYVPFIAAIAAAAIYCGYHYVLEARRRFRHYTPVLAYLDALAAWSSGGALVGAILLIVRHANVPVLSWRLWLYLYVVLVAMTFIGFLFRLYARLPRGLAAHDNDLLKRRYMPPANQRQVANAAARRGAVRR